MRGRWKEAGGRSERRRVKWLVSCHRNTSRRWGEGEFTRYQKSCLRMMSCRELPRMQNSSDNLESDGANAKLVESLPCLRRTGGVTCEHDIRVQLVILRGEQESVSALKKQTQPPPKRQPSSPFVATSHWFLHLGAGPTSREMMARAVRGHSSC